MKAMDFVEDLSELEFENTFNPYSNQCDVHDLHGAPHCRKQTLFSMLEAATQREIDSLWIGRDLGYRGGRRTGLAFTDDIHVQAHAERWGLSVERPTKGEMVAEQTAAVVWQVLSRVNVPVFLWNVFPLHPYEPGSPFSNRSHNARERKAGEEFLSELILLLKPCRLVAIGNDAAQSARRLCSQLKVIQVRHPSHGGKTRFSSQMSELYGLSRNGSSDIGVRAKHFS